MKIALTNLGKYTEGVLDFIWLELPASPEEIEEALNKIEVSNGENHFYRDGRGHTTTIESCCGEYEEYFITDFECDFMDIGEYDSIDYLNEIAEELESLTSCDREIVEALINDGYSLEDAINKKDDCIYYDDCDSMEEVAERYAEETCLLENIPDHLKYYFDFERYGRDLEIEGHWISTNTGYIEVIE